jgi:hypothetical protein
VYFYSADHSGEHPQQQMVSSLVGRRSSAPGRKSANLAHVADVIIVVGLAAVSQAGPLHPRRPDFARELLGTPGGDGHGAPVARSGSRQQASDILALVYGWLTEGFATLDQKQAKAMLDELA